MQVKHSFVRRGKYVTLAPITVSHVTDRYVGWLNDGIVNQYLESRFQHHTLESTARFVIDSIQNPDVLLLAIEVDAFQEKHVGNIKLGPINRHHSTAEIGILVGDRNAWGKGLATDAIEVVKSIAKDELNLRRLTAGCYEKNQGSQRAFLKAGFTLEGRRPGHFLLEGAPEALVLFGCNF